MNDVKVAGGREAVGVRTIDDKHMASLSLSPLFGETFLRQDLMPTQHDGQASWVWMVATTKGDRVVRTSRFASPPDEDFWQGAWLLFDVDTSRVDRLRTIHCYLRPISEIPVPDLLDMTRFDDKCFAVLERMPGRPLESFNALSTEVIHGWGKAMARIHRETFSFCGSAAVLASSQRGFPLRDFHQRMRSVAKTLRDRFYPDDASLAPHWANFEHAVRQLPRLDFASPIMLDMDPSQFLTDGQYLTGLVDTELYAVAPRQWELVGLEYLLDRQHARAFRSGYETVLPMPALGPYRPAYRLLLRLMSFQGPVPWDEWMGHPHNFEA